MTTNDGAVGAKGGSLADERLGIDTMNREVGTGRSDIGEDAGGAAEDIVLYLYSLIDRDIVLDADSIADAHVVADVDILPQRAVPAKAGTALDVAEMPDLRTLAYLYIVVDVARRMYIITFHISDYE